MGSANPPEPIIFMNGNLFYKFIINSSQRSFEIAFLDANDNIEFAGSLVNHSDVYARASNGTEYTRCNAASLYHASAHNCDQRKIIFDSNAICFCNASD